MSIHILIGFWPLNVCVILKGVDRKYLLSCLVCAIGFVCIIVYTKAPLQLYALSSLGPQSVQLRILPHMGPHAPFSHIYTCY